MSFNSKCILLVQVNTSIMAKPDDFELLIKMNRLPPPPVQTSPMPVKFKEVHYDPHFDADKKREDLRRGLEVSKSESNVQPLTGHIFFKDPLCPPELAVLDEENCESDHLAPIKLGRNMRASHGQIGTRRRKGVCDLMNERKKLLHQQKEQHDEITREADSEQLAAALVNDMMQQGFHITPPEMTPRGPFAASTHPSPPLEPSSSSEMENKDGENRRKILPEEEEKRLVLAIHREVKRVTALGAMDMSS